MDPITASQSAGAVLNTIKDVVKFVNKTTGNISYGDVTKAMRVEPIVIVSNDLVNTEFMPDVMQSLQNIFAGYYMQAVTLVGDVNSVKAIKTLDKLNPNVSPIDRNWLYGMENYQFKLPTVVAPKVTFESYANKRNTYVDSEGKPYSLDTTMANKDNVTRLAENVNLSVGKIYTVTVKVTGENKETETVNLPISIRMMVNQVNEKSIVSMLTLMSRDTTFKERWHAYRAGKITFWKDLVLAQDIINESKKLMQNDKEGVLTEIFQRSNNSKLNSVFGASGLNLASATNIYVISKEVADVIESKLTSKLSNFKTREQLLKSGYCMILAVVDKTWERVTFYHRGIAAGSTVGIKDIRAGNKSGGPDVMEVMKALMLGNQPPI